MRYYAFFVACMVALAAHAADEKPAQAMTPQQAKRAECDKYAGDKKGAERRAFVDECLATKEPQQDDMKRCNAEAGRKKGDERKQFMTQCLKGSPKT